MTFDKIDIMIYQLWRFDIHRGHWKKNQLWVKQTTRADWASYYDVITPRKFLTYDGVYSPLKHY